MAKGGGGAWKVAYADFVTAMMAFFLVMWLCAQNSEVKRSVADYFADPMGTLESGSTEKKPNRGGAVSDNITTGSVPLQEKVAQGKGRRGHSSTRLHSPTTKLIRDWLHQDENASQYWQKQVRAQIESARWSKEAKQKGVLPTDIAVQKLATQLREELVREAPAKATGFYRDLVLSAFDEVNWTELAEDLIGQ